MHGRIFIFVGFFVGGGVFDKFTSMNQNSFCDQKILLNITQNKDCYRNCVQDGLGAVRLEGQEALAIAM